MPGGVRSMKGEKQMIYKNITFKADPFSYNLEFDDRITLVGGDSGTGKTVLYEMLEDLRLTDEYKAIKLFNYKSDNFSESIEKCRDSFIVVDNQDIRNKYRMLKSIADKAEGKIIILDMICFEYLILAFDKLVAWTGTGKTDKIKIREETLSAIEDHRINLSKIDDDKTLQYLAGFKRYSTERVMKSLVGEFTQNEKWSVKGLLMGECWYKDCCVSEHPDKLRCGKPEVEDGNDKMRMLIQSEEVQKILKQMYLV